MKSPSPPRRPAASHLLQRVPFDFQLNRFFRRVFNDGVARPELELPGDIADAEHQGAATTVRLLITEERSQRAHQAAFVLGFDRRFWQEEVRFDLLRYLIRAGFSSLACVLSKEVTAIDITRDSITTAPKKWS